MNRDEVLRICYEARRLRELRMAQSARAQFLRNHPDDYEMLEIGGMLTKAIEALSHPGIESISESAPSPDEVVVA